ncbi:hypothetical protein [Butyrivibrio sp. AC2005]|uniref:hypothetical protein n=1 Tax=Butyrivibrio sp. AC2005 TaxID=1280672 RepID=UPI00041D6440|nr:hypothetical protein [Butyrivibrio sp. AC2005]
MVFKHDKKSRNKEAKRSELSTTNQKKQEEGAEAKLIIKVISDGIKKEYSIVNDESKKDLSSNTLFYGDIEARELLTAAFIEKRMKRAIVFGKEA